MLKLDGVQIRQDDFALDADFEIAAGARVAVLGPSGAGKSTLLTTIGGFWAPSAGRIWLDGQDITALPPGKRPLTMLFQDINLFPNLSALENVALGVDPALRLTAKLRAQVEEALEQVGLAGLGARKPAQLSGGQQSRVALARALLRARPLLLLDEPFAALGPALKTEMLGLLAEVLARTKATLLMVTHDPNDALALTPQTLLVAEGKALPPQPTQDLLENPPPALKAYLGSRSAKA